MYLEIDDGFLEHPKTLRFCRVVREPCGAVYLMRLWTWATKSAPDGDLTGLEPEDVELPLRWSGEPGACFAALVACGFIDVDPNGSHAIHNWGARTGGSIVRMEERANEKREAWAAQKARQREAKKAPVPEEPVEMSAPCPPNVQADNSRTSTPCPPPKTRQDKSDLGETRQDPPAQSAARAPDPSAPAQGPAPVVAAAAAAPVPVAKDGEITRAGPVLGIVRVSRPNAHDLLLLFGRLREAIVPKTLPWDTPGANMRLKADEFVERVADKPEVCADIEPTMRLLLEQVRDGADARLRDVSFAFGAWLHRFTDLREELHGRRRDEGAAYDPRDDCEFHRRGRNQGKQAPKLQMSSKCAECRHMGIRASPRPAAGGPSSMSEIMSGLHDGR